MESRVEWHSSDETPRDREPLLVEYTEYSSVFTQYDVCVYKADIEEYDNNFMPIKPKYIKRWRYLKDIVE